MVSAETKAEPPASLNVPARPPAAQALPGPAQLGTEADEDRSMTGLIRRMTARASLGALAGLALVGLAPAELAPVGLGLAGLPLATGVGAAEPAQQSYASPEDAAAALAAASRSHDATTLRSVLGPGSEALLNSGDHYADEAAQNRFVTGYEAHHQLVPQGADRTVLDIGINDWQLPIPLVRRNSRWSFDSREGAQEIVDRRIGGNEIAAIRVSLAYVDAQNDYFARKKQQTGTGEYASRLVSTPNRHDGLYWPAEDGQTDSPLEPLVAQAKDEGYPGEITRQKPVPYQGYFFRILYSQGAEAPDGAKNYVRNGSMTGGFALVAWPAVYGSSGIMSFIVNQDGIVFQNDLGPETGHLVGRMTQFNADPSWARVNLTDQ
jgi:hypothetical protein